MGESEVQTRNALDDVLAELVDFPDPLLDPAVDRLAEELLVDSLAVLPVLQQSVEDGRVLLGALDLGGLHDNYIIDWMPNHYQQYQEGEVKGL